MNTTLTALGLGSALVLGAATQAADLDVEGPDLGATPVTTVTPPPPPPCPMDLNGNGMVDYNDMEALLELWGPCNIFGQQNQDCPGDFNNDGDVGLRDLIELLPMIGRACPDIFGGGPSGPDMSAG